MELNLKNLDNMMYSKMNGDFKKANCNKEEVLSSLYFSISRYIENKDYISHEELIRVCDKIFKKFEVNVDYNRNFDTESTLNQFNHIVESLYAIENLKIVSTLPSNLKQNRNRD